jgi:hypothetical protein
MKWELRGGASGRDAGSYSAQHHGNAIAAITLPAVATMEARSRQGT